MRRVEVVASDKTTRVAFMVDRMRLSKSFDRWELSPPLLFFWQQICFYVNYFCSLLDKKKQTKREMQSIGQWHQKINVNDFLFLFIWLFFVPFFCVKKKQKKKNQTQKSFLFLKKNPHSTSSDVTHAHLTLFLFFSFYLVSFFILITKIHLNARSNTANITQKVIVQKRENVLWEKHPSG